MRRITFRVENLCVVEAQPSPCRRRRRRQQEQQKLLHPRCYQPHRAHSPIVTRAAAVVITTEIGAVATTVSRVVNKNRFTGKPFRRWTFVLLGDHTATRQQLLRVPSRAVRHLGIGPCIFGTAVPCWHAITIRMSWSIKTRKCKHNNIHPRIIIRLQHGHLHSPRKFVFKVFHSWIF